MKYYLGIDAGGSKTLAIVCDQAGRIVGRGHSGCGNHQVGAELAERSIREAVDQALSDADISRESIAFALFGLAGADRETDFKILRPMIAKMGFENHDIVCDTVIALRAGTHQSDGVVCICGTGTNCYGINKKGECFQCGGFGYYYGDFGGGGDLAVEAFRSVIRAWDGREQPTLLTGAILDALGFENVDQMYNHFLDEEKRPPHHLAKLLFDVAQDDAVARDILRRQGLELGKAASAVINRLGMQDDRFNLVLAGSILTRGDSRFVQPYIAEQVKKVAPGCELAILTMEPVAGALLLAMERDGQTVVDSVYDELAQSLSVREGNKG